MIYITGQASNTKLYVQAKMGSESNNQSKRHFDITMSKRTRKPINLEVGGGDHKSLKQLINGNEKPKVNTGEESRSSGRNSLGEHFTEEEKQLQLVTAQQQNSVPGMKFKGMVNRYVKVLSRLIKVKRVGSRNRKPPLRLTMGQGIHFSDEATWCPAAAKSE